METFVEYKRMICLRCQRRIEINLGPESIDSIWTCHAGSDSCEALYLARKEAFLDGINYMFKHVAKHGKIEHKFINKQLKEKGLK